MVPVRSFPDEPFRALVAPDDRHLIVRMVFLQVRYQFALHVKRFLAHRTGHAAGGLRVQRSAKRGFGLEGRNDSQVDLIYVLLERSGLIVAGIALFATERTFLVVENDVAPKVGRVGEALTAYRANMPLVQVSLEVIVKYPRFVEFGTALAKHLFAFQLMFPQKVQVQKFRTLEHLRTEVTVVGAHGIVDEERMLRQTVIFAIGFVGH